MRIPSPTFLRLILIGLAVVTLPLVAAIVTAIVQVDRLAADSRSAVLTVQGEIARSHALGDLALSMERNARQYQALRDAAYLDLYRVRRDEFRATLAALAAKPRGTASLAALHEHVDRVENLTVAAVDAVERGGAPPLEPRFAALRDAVAELIDAYDERARDLRSALPERARALQELLLTQAALVVPLSIGLAALVVLLVSTPLREIQRGIRALGQGALTEQIHLRGTRDIQDLGRRLDWLRRRLIELEAQKSQFLRNVSHELKTPLTNIREAASLLEDDGEAHGREEFDEVIGILRENSIRLQQMIEELLRYGADGDLTHTAVDEAVELDDVVRRVLERHATTAKARRVATETKLDRTTVTGRLKQLEVVVDNLVSNALKYTPPGGAIEIRLGSRANEVTLDVQDSGPGVGAAHAPHVFEWFYVGEPPAGAVIKGTGMGLAIAQEYARQHGGEIALLDSGGGAHFRLRLPVRSHEQS